MQCNLKEHTNPNFDTHTIGPSESQIIQIVNHLIEYLYTVLNLATESQMLILYSLVELSSTKQAVD